jgi:hypothetical protein
MKNKLDDEVDDIEKHYRICVLAIEEIKRMKNNRKILFTCSSYISEISCR